MSDITICDAHHIEEIYPELNVNKGASSILFHTYKGIKLLKKLEKIMSLKKIEYSWVLQHNQQLCHPTIIHPKTNIFYKLIDNGKSFDYAVNKTLNENIFLRIIQKILTIYNNILAKMKNE